MTTLLLGDAFAHHIWATERLIDECEELVASDEPWPDAARGRPGLLLHQL